MIDYAPLIRKVRFPRQLVAFSAVATQLVDVRGDARVLIVARVVARARGARHVLARGPARAAGRRLVVRARRCAGVAERRLPGRRAPRRGGAPALVLPDADPLPVRADRRRRGARDARRRPALGKPGDAADRGAARAALGGRRCRPLADMSTSSSRRRSRSRSARGSSAASTTGSRSSCDGDPAVVRAPVEEPRLAPRRPAAGSPATGSTQSRPTPVTS